MNIPIIDLSLLKKEGGIEQLTIEVGDACRDIGFFYVINHGIEKDLINELFKTGHEFFEKPVEDKQKISMNLGGNAYRGYFILHGELTSKKPDHKEGIYFGSELPDDHPMVIEKVPLHGKNLWPDDHMKEIVLEYMNALTELGHQLMEFVGRSLNLDPNFFREKYTSEPFIPFRLFYYPPDVEGVHDDNTVRWGVGEHTDYGVLTLLAQDDIGGLQIKLKDGEWIEAPPIEDSFVVNIGDMLSIWTNGLYKATPHRVKNESRRGRLSAPFFFDPCFNCIIEPVSTENELFVKKDSPWSKPFKYGDYYHMKMKNNFPDLNGEVKRSNY